jgi:hypothetical protein
MGDPLEQGKLLLDKIRTFVRILRNSPSEIVTATLAALFFLAATAVLGNEFIKAILPPSTLQLLRIGFFAISGCLALWTVFQSLRLLSLCT